LDAARDRSDSFEEHTLLRIHSKRLASADAEEPLVEFSCVVEKATAPTVLRLTAVDQCRRHQVLLIDHGLPQFVCRGDTA
jgi:hypothetical protein